MKNKFLLSLSLGICALPAFTTSVAAGQFSTLVARVEIYVGGLYAEGKYVKKDPAEAAKWYQRAADLGSADAKYKLGVLFFKGEGVKKDYTKAILFFVSAAAMDDAASETFLGFIYRNGYGVKQDYAEALRWYRKAAIKGDKDALAEINRYREAKKVAKALQQKYHRILEYVLTELDIPIGTAEFFTTHGLFSGYAPTDFEQHAEGNGVMYATDMQIHPGALAGPGGSVYIENVGPINIFIDPTGREGVYRVNIKFTCSLNAAMFISGAIDLLADMETGNIQVESEIPVAAHGGYRYQRPPQQGPPL